MWFIGKAWAYRSKVCRFDPHLWHFGIISNSDIRYHRSWMLDYTEDGKVPESWRKTPISSEKLDIENAKLLEQSVAIGNIQ
jgi:hypothetical protein